MSQTMLESLEIVENYKRALEKAQLEWQTNPALNMWECIHRHVKKFEKELHNAT